MIVPLHTQVAADVPGATRRVVFETERALIALAAPLDAVLLDSGFELTDVSAANDDAQIGFAPFGQHRAHRRVADAGLRLDAADVPEHAARPDVLAEAAAAVALSRPCS